MPVTIGDCVCIILNPLVEELIKEEVDGTAKDEEEVGRDCPQFSVNVAIDQIKIK